MSALRCAALAACLVLLAACHSHPASRISDLNGNVVSLFPATGAHAVVLVFVSIECPISNRYAPEYNRLHSRHSTNGVLFRLVYPNADESAGAIQQHVKEYSLAIPALRDPAHELVRLCKVSVTPEAAVLSPQGALLYHGRVDDRFPDYGQSRVEASHRDLDIAIHAVLAGKPAPQADGPAKGCSIAN